MLAIGRRDMGKRLCTAMKAAYVYQGHARTCPECGEFTRATIPDAVRDHSVGPRLTATLSYFSGCHGVSKRGEGRFSFHIAASWRTFMRLTRFFPAALLLGAFIAVPLLLWGSAYGGLLRLDRGVAPGRTMRKYSRRASLFEGRTLVPERCNAGVPIGRRQRDAFQWLGPRAQLALDFL